MGNATFFCCAGHAGHPVQEITVNPEDEADADKSNSSRDCFTQGPISRPLNVLEDACCGNRAKQRNAMRESQALRPGARKPKRVKAEPSGNRNQPEDYAWLEGVLAQVAANNSQSLGCMDAESGKPFTPLFLVIGACPSALAPMQAVIFCAGEASGEVDFWYVKPTSAGDVEPETLKRQSSGPHKNDPGASRKVLLPLAEFFAKQTTSKSGSTTLQYGIEGTKPPRAYVEQINGKETLRMWLVAVWMENWSSNPFASEKFVAGKLVYEKKAAEKKFFARQFRIVDEAMSLLDYEEPEFSSALPPASVKDLWEIH